MTNEVPINYKGNSMFQGSASDYRTWTLAGATLTTLMLFMDNDASNYNLAGVVVLTIGAAMAWAYAKGREDCYAEVQFAKKQAEQRSEFDRSGATT